MKRCPSCNKRLRKNSDACRRCGWKKRKSILDFFKREKLDPTGVCWDCGKKFYHAEKECDRCGWKTKRYRASFSLLFYSFLIPLFGFICAYTVNEDTPKKAKDCNIAAILGIIAYVLLIAICAVIEYML